jgi:hypothetical protein
MLIIVGYEHHVKVVESVRRQDKTGTIFYYFVVAERNTIKVASGLVSIVK